MAYNNIDEHQIKQRIKSIIQTYHSLGLMSDSDVKINEVVEENGIFEVIGEYHYKSIFPRDTGESGNESGTFNIRLDNNLQHKSVRITKDARP